MKRNTHGNSGDPILSIATNIGSTLQSLSERANDSDE